jgi:hypothetical protein
MTVPCSRLRSTLMHNNRYCANGGPADTAIRNATCPQALPSAPTLRCFVTSSLYDNPDRLIVLQLACDIRHCMYCKGPWPIRLHLNRSSVLHAGRARIGPTPDQHLTLGPAQHLTLGPCPTPDQHMPPHRRYIIRRGRNRTRQLSAQIV